MHYTVPAAALLSIAAVASAQGQHPLYTRSHEVYARNPVAASIDPNNFISAQDLYARMAEPEPEYNIPPSALRARQIAILRRSVAPRKAFNRRHDTGRPHTHSKSNKSYRYNPYQKSQRRPKKQNGVTPPITPPTGGEVNAAVEPQTAAAPAPATEQSTGQTGTQAATQQAGNRRRSAMPKKHGKHGKKHGKHGKKHGKHGKHGKKHRKGGQQGGQQGAEAGAQVAEAAATAGQQPTEQPPAGGDAGAAPGAEAAAAPAPAPAKFRRNALAIASRSAAPEAESTEQPGFFARIARSLGF